MHIRLLPRFLAPDDSFVIDTTYFPGDFIRALVLFALWLACRRWSLMVLVAVAEFIGFIMLVQIVSPRTMWSLIWRNSNLPRLIGCITLTPVLAILLPFGMCCNAGGDHDPDGSNRAQRAPQAPPVNRNSRVGRPDQMRVEARMPACGLCQKCDSIVKLSRLLSRLPSEGDAERYDHHNIRDLHKSAQTCHLCQLFWFSLTRRQRNRVFEHLPQDASISTSLPLHHEVDSTLLNLEDSESSTLLPCSAHLGKSKNPIPVVERTSSLSTNETPDLVNLNPEFPDEETCMIKKAKMASATKGKLGDHHDAYGTFSSVKKSFRVKLWKEREESATAQDSGVWMQFEEDEISEARPLKIEELLSSGEHKCLGGCNLPHMVDSIASLRWAKSQIDACGTTHDKCGSKFVPQGSSTYRPKRLLHVQTAEDSTIRLIETAELGVEDMSSLIYVALSHCWGGAISMVLSAKNREEMRSIEINKLPRNFKDAVSVTRQIDVRYLWIDSLCIEQGSTVEWETESTYMGLTYANAKCIISATAAKGSTGGCFVSENPFSKDCILSPPAGPALIVRSGTPGLESSLVSLMDGKVETVPLNSRAWAFQERFLARCVLHFCDGIIIFECNTAISSQQHGGVPYRSIAAIRADGRPHSPVSAKPKWEARTFLPMSASDTILETYTVFVPGSRRSFLRPVTRPASRGKMVTKTRTRRNPAYEDQLRARERARSADRAGQREAELQWELQVEREWEHKISKLSARMGMRGLSISYQAFPEPPMLGFSSSITDGTRWLRSTPFAS